MDKKDFKTLRIVDIDDLAYQMIQDATEGKSSTSVLYFEDATKLAKSLMTDPDVAICSVEISEPLFGGYNDVYYVSLLFNKDSEPYELFVEPALSKHNDAKTDQRYLFDSSDCLYIMDDAPKDVYDCVVADEAYIVVDGNNQLSQLIDEFLNAEFDFAPHTFIHFRG
jgi:hypothetical protein